MPAERQAFGFFCRVGAPPLAWGRKQIQIPKRCVFWFVEIRTMDKSRSLVVMSVTHHRQNSLECIPTHIYCYTVCLQATFQLDKKYYMLVQHSVMMWWLQWNIMKASYSRYWISDISKTLCINRFSSLYSMHQYYSQHYCRSFLGNGNLIFSSNTINTADTNFNSTWPYRTVGLDWSKVCVPSRISDCNQALSCQKMNKSMKVCVNVICGTSPLTCMILSVKVK
jgi:hypothetical protein